MSMKPVRRWGFVATTSKWEMDFVKTDKGNYVLLEDYVALERRNQELLDAIERTGGLDKIRMVEVSQPVVIDMARKNAFLKGENARLKAEREWQPIETAPDKARIIICAFNGEIEIIYSSDLCYYPESQYPRCWMPLSQPPTN